MGPAPMISIDLRSVRLGMLGASDRMRRSSRLLSGHAGPCGLVFVHQCDEPIEQVINVMRTGTGFGMPLKAECRTIGTREPLQTAVEQRYMRHAHVRRER